MKGLLCVLLLLESFVFVVQQRLSENEINHHLSSEDRRQNSPQTHTSGESQEYCPLSFTDIHAALRELTATVTEQKANIRALETRLKDAEKTAEQQTLLLEELNKKNDEISTITQSQVEELKKQDGEISNLTQSQVEELKKDIRDREIAFSTTLLRYAGGELGPFNTEITIIYRHVFTNIGNAYNPNTGFFTAPLKGAYMFQFSIVNLGPPYPSSATIMKNGDRMVMAHANQAEGVLNSAKSVVLILEVGDVVSVTLWANCRIQENQGNQNTFSGYLLFPLE